MELKIKDLRLQGKGYKTIANELGVTRDVVRYYCKKLGMDGVMGEVQEKKESKPKPPKHCVNCNCELSGSQSKYCGNGCRKKFNTDAYRPTVHTKSCSRCNKVFATTNKPAKYCSDECLFLTKSCEGCGKEYRTRNEDKKYCSMKCFNHASRKTHEDYMQEFFNIHKGNMVPLELYKGSDHLLKALCLHCNNETERLARVYIGANKYGCSTCKNKSHGEDAIQRWLDDHGISYAKQYSFDDLRYRCKLFFDFAIFDGQGDLIKLIEYDGEFHFESIERLGGDKKLAEQRARDQAKNEYVEDENIPLLRISYKQKKSVSAILKLELLGTTGQDAGGYFV